jgi:hypothetical protein
MLFQLLNGVLKVSVNKKRKEKEMVNSVLRKKKHKDKETLTCYSNLQMALWKISIKKREEKWLIAFL